MFWWDTLWFTGMPSFVNLAENRSKGKGFGIGQESLVFVKTVEKTWPGLGVGEGQGCRGEGVGQGPGMWSIDSIDHQKPGESCWGERGGGVWCYLEWELRVAGLSGLSGLGLGLLGLVWSMQVMEEGAK